MYQDRVDKLKSYSRESLVREGSDITFSDLRVEIDVLLDFFVNFYEYDEYRKGFNANDVQSINDIYNRTVSTFDRIATTTDWGSLNSSDIQSFKNSIRNEFTNVTANNYYVRIQAAQALEAQKSDESAAKRKETQELLRYLKQQVKEVEHNVSQSKEALAQTIENSYGKEFEKRAVEHGKAAQKWLAVLAGSLAAYSLFAGWIIYKLLDKNISEINGVSAFFKIAALLGGLYLIGILNRNYAANKHLENVNSHRASIFAVINELVDAQKDDTNKQFLLAYGAKVIFDMGESGYLSRNYGAGSDDDGILTPLLEKLGKVK